MRPVLIATLLLVAFSLFLGLSTRNSTSSRSLPTPTYEDLDVASLHYAKRLNDRRRSMVVESQQGQESRHLKSLGWEDGISVKYLGDGVFIVHSSPYRPVHANSMVKVVQEAPLYKGHFLVKGNPESLPSIECSNRSAALSSELKRFILGRCNYLVPRDYE